MVCKYCSLFGCYFSRTFGNGIADIISSQVAAVNQIPVGSIAIAIFADSQLICYLFRNDIILIFHMLSLQEFFQ